MEKNEVEPLYIYMKTKVEVKKKKTEINWSLSKSKTFYASKSTIEKKLKR